MAAVDGSRGSFIGPCRQTIGACFATSWGCVFCGSTLCRPWHPSPRHPAALVSAYLPSLVPTAILNPSDSSLLSHLCLMCHPPSLSLGGWPVPLRGPSPPACFRSPVPACSPFIVLASLLCGANFSSSPCHLSHPPSQQTRAPQQSTQQQMQAMHIQWRTMLTCDTHNWGNKGCSSLEASGQNRRGADA